MSNACQQILIIDSEPAIRTLVRILLELNGYRVIEAETALRGEIEVSTHNPDLVLVDLGTADEGGLVLIRHIRCRSPVPIVVLSSRITQEEKVLALRAGADDYVTKPFSAPELLARIAARLRRVGAPGNEFPQGHFQ
jgi:two-component system, OmpR family, KDP operon response regulator KdpE